MRRVFSNADNVIHVFAQQSQAEGRSSNCFFEKSDWRDSEFGKSVDYGTRLYSYGHHYLLAEFLDANTIMINDNGYSSTTNKHIGKVLYATRQYKQFFTTRTDVRKVHDTVTSLMDKLPKARKPEKYTNEINSLFESLNEYIDWQIKKKCYNNTKSTKEYREIRKFVKIANSETSIEDLKAAQKKAAAKKRKEDAKKLVVALEKFNNYEINSFRIGNEDYLRISKDGSKVQTSQGITVEVDEARLLYLAIKQGKDIVGHRISYYTVNSINGVLTIGCHRINMGSVKQVGEQLLKK